MPRLLAIALCLGTGYLAGRSLPHRARSAGRALTERQREILTSVALGLTDKQIGARIGMAQTTV